MLCSRFSLRHRPAFVVLNVWFLAPNWFAITLDGCISKANADYMIHWQYLQWFQWRYHFHTYLLRADRSTRPLLILTSKRRASRFELPLRWYISGASPPIALAIGPHREPSSFTYKTN
jgi:hypothetical protein